MSSRRIRGRVGRRLTAAGIGLLILAGLRAFSDKDEIGRRPQIAFDFSSLRKLILQPEAVLADVEGFWRKDKAYWLTACWHKNVGYPVPPPGWTEAIKKLAGRPAQDRESNPLLQLSRSLEKDKDPFLGFALPLLASLLPRGGCDVSTTVFLTTAIVPHSFQMNFHIVFNAAAANPQNRENEIFNTIVHELFHVGYYRCECLMTEIPSNSAEEYDLMYSLQNEGLAAFAGYFAAKEYPADVFQDYAKLGDAAAVEKAIGRVNSLMAGAASRPADEFRKDLFQVGVQQRALYIAGAFMARTIDEKLGRQALASTMERGPRNFISLYNSQVVAPLKISEIPLPEPPTPCQRMRRAAVAEDYGNLAEILEAMKTGTREIIHPAGHILQNTGQLLLRREKYGWARSVFEVYKRFFPGHVNPYEGLGDACLKLGDRDEAVRNYEEVIKLSPGHIRVLGILKDLRKTASSQEPPQSNPRSA